MNTDTNHKSNSGGIRNSWFLFWFLPVLVLLTGLSGRCLLEANDGPASSGNAGDREERPNILFIMSDDHAYHALSCYGSRINRTPQIDRLAEQGMRFNRAFVRTSLCVPSRAAILTGMGGRASGLLTNRDSLKEGLPVVSELLQEAGYQTAVVGKWHLSSPTHGFDYRAVLPGQGRYHDPVFRTSSGKKKIEGFTTDVITDLALDWLRNRNGDKPFFMMLQHKAPHGPVLQYKEEYADRYREDLPLPSTLMDDYETRPGPKLAKGQYTWLTRMVQNDLDLDRPDGLSEKEMRRWMYQHYFKAYLRQVASLDDNVGRVLDFLKEHGLDENTVVIYTTDNGFFLGDHGWYNKMWMYEESIRIPLLVRWPGRSKPGSRSDRLVSNVDFAPTFLDVAGRNVPEHMQGRSLVPILRGKTPKSWREAIYYYYQGQYGVPKHEGVRTERYKLIHYPDAGKWEFFDLKNDPEELNNRYGSDGYGKQVRRLRKKLKELRDRYGR